jgi:hypothetical protein
VVAYWAFPLTYQTTVLAKKTRNKTTTPHCAGHKAEHKRKSKVRTLKILALLYRSSSRECFIIE